MPSDELRFGPSVDARAGLRDGDYVMIASAEEQASRWILHRVLWTDGADILVEQRGAGGTRPYKDVIAVDRVRCFGSAAFCEERRREAEKVQAGAAAQLAALQDMVTDVRVAVDRLIAAVNAQTLAACADRASAEAEKDAPAP